FPSSADPLYLHSFPTRRSSDLAEELEVTGPVTLELWASSSALDTDFTSKLVDVDPDGRAMNVCDGVIRARYRNPGAPRLLAPGVDRKSTRLNSSHVAISYAVFC